MGRHWDAPNQQIQVWKIALAGMLPDPIGDVLIDRLMSPATHAQFG